MALKDLVHTFFFFFNVTAELDAAAAAERRDPGAAPGPGWLAAAAAREGGAAAQGGGAAGLREEPARREDGSGAEAGTARQGKVGAQEGAGEGDDIVAQLQHDLFLCVFSKLSLYLFTSNKDDSL